MTVNVQWPTIGGSVYPIPEDGETNWADLTNYLVAIAQAQGTTSQKTAARVVTATPATVSSANDCVISVELGSPAPAEVQLPAGVPGQWFAIVDGLRDAGTNNITVLPNGSETIQGNADYVMNQNGAAVGFSFVNGDWKVIFQAAGEGAGGGVARSAIDAGTPNHVVINAGDGKLSSEAQLAASRGGLGVNASSFSGFLKMTAGVASVVTLITDADLAAGIDAAKIGSGDVSNTEWQTLNGITSNIQNQLNAKEPSLPSQTGNAGAFLGTDGSNKIWTNLSPRWDMIPGAAPSHLAGRLFYDATDDCLAYYNSETEIKHNIGEELWAKARNSTGSTILNGKVVYVTGATGQLPTIALARANAASTARNIGVVTHDIENNSNGFVTTFGIVRDIDTSAFSDGAMVYLSSATAGELTSTPPVAPNYSMLIGVILHAHPTQGKILVDPQNTLNLGLGTSNQLLGMNSAGTAQEYKTAQQSRTQILPSQSGNAGKILQTDGTDVSWQDDGGGSGGLTPVPVTATGTAVANTIENVTLPGATIVRTMPSLPLGGDDPIVVRFQDAGRTCSSTLKITIAPASGEPIDGYDPDGTVSIDYAGGWIELSASPGDGSWKMQTQANSLAPPPGMVPGYTGGVAIPAGYIGERIETVQTTPTNISTSNQYQDLGSIALTSGVWMLSMMAAYALNGATCTQIYGGIGTASGTGSTGLALGSTQANQSAPGTGFNTSYAIPGYYVNISSPTTYYAKVSASFTAGNPQYTGRLTAVRIA